MIPLHDENPTTRFPAFTIGLIAVNVLVFFQGLAAPGSLGAILDTYGLVPVALIQEPSANYPNIFSAMFLHAGLGHLAGNMLYLWIFGNNIEDVLGPVRFLMFYFLCGVVAALSHVASNPDSPIPMVGASGAISGILGAYLVLFPYARVKTLVFLGFYVTIVRVPAVILLGLWMLIQVMNSLAMGAGGAGVAWLAHIGGFVAGMILIQPFLASLPPASRAP